MIQRIETPGRELRVTRAGQDDLKQVLKLWVEAAEWLTARGINQWRPDTMTRESVLKQWDISEIYLFRIGDQAAGTLAIQWTDPFMWRELDNGESGYVHRLAVSRSLLGQGLGSQLLAWAAHYVLEQGRRYMRLDCMADNERLNRYYRERGFKLIKRIDVKNWSANLYEKPLHV